MKRDGRCVDELVERVRGLVTCEEARRGCRRSADERDPGREDDPHVRSRARERRSLRGDACAIEVLLPYRRGEDRWGGRARRTTALAERTPTRDDNAMVDALAGLSRCTYDQSDHRRSSFPVCEDEREGRVARAGIGGSSAAEGWTLGEGRRQRDFFPREPSVVRGGSARGECATVERRSEASRSGVRSEEKGGTARGIGFQELSGARSFAAFSPSTLICLHMHV